MAKFLSTKNKRAVSRLLNIKVLQSWAPPPFWMALNSKQATNSEKIDRLFFWASNERMQTLLMTVRLFDGQPINGNIKSWELQKWSHDIGQNDEPEYTNFIPFEV